MTSAPANLLAVRRLLLTYLNVDERTTRSQDLEPAEVGIVGDPNHRGGYHCGSDRVVTNDYSVVESPRDRAGLDGDASALDVGLFQVQSGGRSHTLFSFSTWLVGQCGANSPDTRDIREVIYSPDGKTVKRWDRLRKRSTGDSSHLFHTHISFFRDSIRAGRDQTPLFHRYLTAIGLEKAATPSETPVAMSNAEKTAWATTNRTDALLSGKDADYQIEGETTRRHEVNQVAASLARVEAYLVTLSGKDFTDEPAVIRGVLAGLAPERIAELVLAGLAPERIAQLVLDGLPAEQAKQVADELAVRLAN